MKTERKPKMCRRNIYISVVESCWTTILYCHTQPLLVHLNITSIFSYPHPALAVLIVTQVYSECPVIVRRQENGEIVVASDMLQLLTSEIANSGVIAREGILFDVCKCIAGAVKAKEFILYLVQGETLVKHDQGADKG